MKLILYNNHSENNKVDKTLIKIIELDGTLRESSSLINPSILIELNPNNLSKSYVVDNDSNYVVYNNIKIKWDSFIYDYVLSANYVYIEEFNRYYFINDIISVRNNLWRINMNVDVLMSYKKQIKKLKAFVNRNEFTFDEYVKDDLISYYYDKEIIEFTPNKGDKVNTNFTTDFNTNKRNVLISVINQNSYFAYDEVYPPDEGLSSVENRVCIQGTTTDLYATTPIYVQQLSSELLNDDTLYSYVISVIAYPFELPNDDDERNVTLGKTELELTKGALISPRLSKYFVIADFTINGEDFKDYEPFTQYQIWIPYLTWINVSADDILNNRIIVYYTINYQTGSAQVTMYDCTNKRVIFTSTCQLGVKIGMTSTNAREVEDAQNSNNIGLGVGLLTSVLAIAGGAISANPVAVAGGVLSAGSTIAKYVQNQNTNYNKAYGSFSNPIGCLYLPQDVRIRKTRLKPKNYDEDYAKLYGKPLNKYMNLSELEGYTILGEVHIEDIGSITLTEFNELYNILTTGFIL